MDVCYWFCYFRFNWHVRRRRLCLCSKTKIFDGSEPWFRDDNIVEHSAHIFAHVQRMGSYNKPCARDYSISRSLASAPVLRIRPTMPTCKRRQKKKIRKEKNLHSFVQDLDDFVGCRHQESIRQLLSQCILYAMPVAHSYRDHLWRHHSTKKRRENININVKKIPADTNDGDENKYFIFFIFLLLLGGYNGYDYRTSTTC